jgi:F-type H+-transporting ATPase subunit a
MLVLIETISYLARAVSLGVRLFANLVAGKVLAYIVSSGIYGFFSKGILVSILALIPITIFVALLGLELAVALIQSYVFTILTCSYIVDAIKLH